MAQFEVALWLIGYLFSMKKFRFDWDKGNLTKSLEKHKVTKKEAQQIFRERRFQVLGVQISPIPKDGEERYAVIGWTKQNRELYVSFTFRGKKIRVISARKKRDKDMRS